jgi:hypothetical protein
MSATRKYSVDKSSLSTVQKTQTILAKAGKKQMDLLTSAEGDYT